MRLPIAQVDAGEGPPVVLIHGLAGSSRWWKRAIPALARERRVYALDLADFGANHPRPLAPLDFRLEEAADCVKAWMDEAGIERASVIGHSMGGCVALDLAARYPEAVDHLVLVDPSVLPPGTRLGRSALGLARSMRYTAPDFLPLLAADALRAGPRAIVNASRQIHALNLRERLADVRVPTLVVWGDHDRIVPPEAGEALAQAIPGARLRVIDGAGHMPMWDRPEEFNRVTLAFLRDEEETPPPGPLRSPPPRGEGEIGALTH